MELRKKDNLDDSTKIIRTTTAFNCGGRCLLRLHIKNNHIVRIETDDAQESEQLRACLRCRAYRKHVHHPDRLQYPQKRVGSRGEGKFERISWDEALNTIADALTDVKEKYGNESILLASGGGYLGSLHPGGRATAKLLAMFGGFTNHYGNISSEGPLWAALIQFGTTLTSHSRDDLLKSKLIIMWGWDPARMIAGTNSMYLLVRAKEAGAKVISIDPRYHDSAAAVADEWIPIYPGTDTAMMSAMAYVMIDEELHDRDFLEKYSVGFDTYKDYVMGDEDGVPKTPKWAESICGVDEKTITRLARLYATVKPAALIDSHGPPRSAMGEQFTRGAFTLCTMTGNIGRPGGGVGAGFLILPFGGTPSIPGLKNPVEAGGPSLRGNIDLNLFLERRIHTNKIFDAIIEGKKEGYPADIRLAWFLANNFLNQLGNTNKGVRALQKLDFCIVSELFMTPTAKYADIVLPVTSAVERNDLTSPWPSGTYYPVINKAIEPLGECKSDLEIAAALAEKLGFEDTYPFSEEEWIKRFAEENPVLGSQIKDYQRFREEGVHRMKLPGPYVAFKAQIEDLENNPFPTPSGKIEIYSERVAQMNSPECPPIPKYIRTKEDVNDPLREKYPLQLISPHPKNRVHSDLRHIDWLMEVEPHRAWINTVDAQARGIENGDCIYVFNDRGKLAIHALVTERIIPGVICIFEGAWYEPDEHGIDKGGCVNVLTDDGYTRGGASTFNTVLVQIEKA
ncbi:MAG: molybdopterin-dependent oxidoreductase [Desulfobacteraceae bacterium]|nr:molybdopterin-dependent oxidoreductase [Desulfobacteraceae bacterium]